MRSISAFAGPVGWAVTAIWTAFDLASPAYRVTVPCVVQLAYMRQKMKSGDIPKCKECGELLPPEKKFCAECGAKTEGDVVTL
jgi:Ubiquinol-cytochrome C chaperone